MFKNIHCMYWFKAITSVTFPKYEKAMINITTGFKRKWFRLQREHCGLLLL